METETQVPTVSVELNTEELTTILQGLAIKKAYLENPDTTFSPDFRQEHIESTTRVQSKLLEIYEAQPDKMGHLLKMMLETFGGM